MARFLLTLGLLVGSALGGTVLWDGRFNDLTSSADLLKWSWSTEVGPYQYYIHGSGNITEYVNLSPAYKNPADTSSKQGVKMTIDSTSYWNGQTMRRTELLPQTTAAINAGKVYYHFSMSRSDTNAPSIYLEHQVNFFESHFTEMKYGLISGESGTSDNQLRWMVSQVTHWNTTWEAGVWHNCAYEIDFTGGTIGFWHSTGSDPLTQVVAPVAGSPSSNGEDWHLGVLRLPMSSSLTSPDVEDWYFSGVYIESGSITTSVTGPGGSSSSSASSVSSTTTSASPSSLPSSTTTSTTSSLTTSTTLKTSTTTTLKTSSTTTTSSSVSSTTTAAGGTIAKWAQCGGTGWTGSGTCVAGSTCTVLNAWYSQCL